MNDKKFTIQLLSNYQQRCFVEFLTEWKKEHEEEYLAFRDDLESNTSGDFSVYAKLFEMAVECIPANILVMCKELFGAEVLPSEIDDNKREIDELVEKFLYFDGYARFDTSQEEWTEEYVTEKDEPDTPKVFYFRIPGIDEWWNGIPANYRMLALMFLGSREEELKMQGRRLILAGLFCMNEIICNLCDLALEKQNPILLSGLYYIVLDHGLRSTSKLMSNAMSSMGAQSMLITTLVTNVVGKLVSTSVSKGYDKKADWKKDAKEYNNTDIQREVTAELAATQGRHGRHRIQQETQSLDDILIAKDKPALKEAIMAALNDMEHEYETAYIKAALIRSGHMDKDMGFEPFLRAVNRFSGKEYKKDPAQRINAEIVYDFREKFEMSKTSKHQRGRRIILYLSDKFWRTR